MWLQSGHKFKPEGRAQQERVVNPQISYLDENAPDTIAHRVSSEERFGCTRVFESAVPRLFEPDDATQGAKYARGCAPDPSFPGPGHYQVTEPVDWQRHDLLIRMDTHHCKIRPHAAFELPKARPLLDNKKETPGPGWYEHHQNQRTDDSPSAPAWQPVLPLADQAQSSDKSPRLHFKLADDTSTWSSGGRTAASAIVAAAVQDRFATTVSLLGATRPFG